MRARRRLFRPVVHRLLEGLLRGLLLVGIDDLIGGLALLFERDRDIERKFVHVGHRLDLRPGAVGQRIRLAPGAVVRTASARCRPPAGAPRWTR